MNENEKAMEGRTILSDGKDLGDKRFHDVGWGTTPEAAHADLGRIAAADATLAEQQAEMFAAQDAEMGIKIFKTLLVLYPDHALTSRWKKRIKELT